MNQSKLDPFTFGNSKAAVVLADILSNCKNRRYTKFVSKHWNGYTAILHGIWYSKMSIAHKTYLIDMLTNNKLESIKNSNLPENIKSYLENIISSRRSIWNKVATKLTLVENNRRRL